MKKYFGLLIGVCFLIGLIGTFVILREGSSGSPLDLSSATLSTSTGQATTRTAADVGLPMSNIPEGYKEYRNEQFGFSVYYPKDIPPKEKIDHGPELTVVFQNSAGTEGFQIYAAPIEGSQISEERFLRDAPSGVRKDPVDTTIGGVQSVAFYGFDAHIGDTREVWFIKGHWLYEVTSYKQLEPWLNGILATWRFL